MKAAIISGKDSCKFMQVLDKKVYRELGRIAQQRGIRIQELIRVDIIPTFLYGPLQIDNRAIRKWQRMGILKNGFKKHG